MSKLFIDLGGHKGQTIAQFYRDVLDAAEWIIYSFEPVEFNLLVANTKKYKNVHCLNVVAGVNSGTIKIYPTKKAHGQGSTTLCGKTTGWVAYDKGVEVAEINFVKWFKELVQPDDFVILKMNIEGGEYILMSHLPEIMPNLAGLYIKLHHQKFKGEQKLKMLQIYEKFRQEILKYKTFVFCDTSEEKYKFKWMLNEIEKICVI